MKKIYYVLISFIILLLGIFTYIKFTSDEEIIIDPVLKNEYDVFKTNYIVTNNYEEYLQLKNNNYNFDEYDDVNEENELIETDFENSKYYFITFDYNSCGEEIVSYDYKIENKVLKIYYLIDDKCGVCDFEPRIDKIKLSLDETIENVESYYKTRNSEICNPVVAYKPMIYIYPTEDMDLTIKLGNTSLLTSTYPKYKNEWNIHVNKNGNIYDYNTKRNYYGLYWEGIDYTKLTYKEGFVVEGKETVSFLEDKLEILGLNEYEINEFITYWISKLENNKYNYIYFRTIDEINNYMKLEISNEPETLIRVFVDFKPLDKYFNVTEQKLNKITRKGYTIVEWGATIHND